MAEMRVAYIADTLHPLQKGGSVEAVRNSIGRDRLGKRGPARAGFKFLRRIEENGVAANARIDPGLKQAAHLRAECALRARLPGDVILLGAQLPAPFRLGLHDLVVRSRVAV